MSLYIGIDIGGTTIKGIILDENGKICVEDSIVTGKGEDIADNTVTLVNRMKSAVNGDCKGVGIGCAGVIDSQDGKVVLANNLQLKNFPLAEMVQRKVNLPVKITNDANAAALGEAKFGAGKNYSDSILITLGTGVGGGIVIDGKLFEGHKSAGAELGHMVIEHGGNRCSCGRKGCFEAYSSATALIKRTKWAMEENPGSKMWLTYTPDTASGKTAFEYAECDIAASEVVEWYIKYLACGLTNLANIFRPQVIMLGGGVSGQKERLTAPLQSIVDRETFASDYAPVKITTATLGSAAGAYGAAALIME
ncbi:MAG: ROK family protein [Clostridia bacterium]|nr:ROK family protein [Clostridia bacterium]